MEQILSRKPKSKTKILFGVAIAVSFFLGLWFRNFIPIAIVDGQFVNRTEFVSLLVEQAGKSVMQKIVIKKYVNDEAKRRKIKVTKEELQEQIKFVSDRLKREHATFEQYLAVQKLTERQFLEEMDLQLKVKKIFGPGILVTTKEIDQYLKDHKIVKGKGAIYESQKIDVYDALFKAKLQNAFKIFLIDKLKKAKIHYFIKL